MCNLVIGVTANKDEQIKRICKRDGLTQKEALARLEAQPNNEFYKKNIKFISLEGKNYYSAINQKLMER